MSLRRKMERKKLKEWTYENHIKKKKAQAHQMRYNNAMVKAGERWKKVVSDTAPKWAQYAAEKWVSPPWYDKLMLWLLNSLPPQEFAYEVVNDPRLPRWVKWALLIPLTWLRSLINWVFVWPVIRLKHMLRAFGIRTKIQKIGKDTLRMRIWYWFDLIDETEWPF
jgi:hypothetical protein